jgi:hypothetical protein
VPHRPVRRQLRAPAVQTVATPRPPALPPAPRAGLTASVGAAGSTASAPPPAPPRPRRQPYCLGRVAGPAVSDRSSHSELQAGCSDLQPTYRYRPNALSYWEKQSAPIRDRGACPCGSRGDWDHHTWGGLRRYPHHGVTSGPFRRFPQTGPPNGSKPALSGHSRYRPATRRKQEQTTTPTTRSPSQYPR